MHVARRRSHRVALALLLAHLVAREARGAEATVEFHGGFPVTSRAQLYPLSRVKRGDKGVGYTVLSGDKLTRFEFEVLGIMESMLGPHKDVILARLSGAEIEFTGVIAGMSGSPAYIDGRLVGAVAYRFGTFSREPIAGITPIESMIAAARGDGLEPSSEAGPRADAPATSGPRADAPATSGGGLRLADVRPALGAPLPAAPRTPVPSGAGDARPIDTPIMISGLDPSVLAELRARLEGSGFVVAAGGGGGERASGGRASGPRVQTNRSSIAGGAPAAPIAPGAPLAAVLMRGDVNAAATGTVTFLEGDEVLAFGHPFLGYGKVAYPLATASILNTLASPLGSYKMGATAIEVGAITQDRLTAIGGRLGGVARMVPVHVRVERADQPRDPGVDTRVEIVPDPTWFPQLFESILSSSAAGRLTYEAGGTVDVDARIEVGEHVLHIVDSYAAEPPTKVSAYAARDLANTALVIERNGLVPAEVTGADVRIRLRPEVDFSVLEQIVPDRTVVHAGEALGLTARLRPYKRSPVTVRLNVEIPEDARGDVEVFVGGGSDLERREGEVYGDRYPSDVVGLLKVLGDRHPARALYGRTFVQRPGLRANAEILSDLPPSERQLLAAIGSRTSRPVSETMGRPTTQPYPDVVLGGISIPVTVVR